MILDALNIQTKIDDLSPSVILPDKELTYSEIKNLTKRASNFLYAGGVRPGDRCAILMENNIEFLIAVLSLWQIKAIPVPINTRLALTEAKELIDFCGCSAVLSERNDENFSAKSITLSLDELFEYDNFSTDDFHFSPNDLAVIIFTSGSGGLPKGVMHSFRSLIQSCLIGDQILRHTESDRWLASLPFYHIGGFSIIFRSLFFRSSLIIPLSLKIEDLTAALRFRPTNISFVSTQLKRLIEQKISPNKELRNVLLGGGFIDDELIEKAEQNGWEILKVYGSSETAAFISAADAETIRKKSGTVGKPLPPNQIFIVDDDGIETAAGKFGEIVIESPALFQGYFRNEEETKNRLKNNKYFSGDIGSKDSEGYVYIEARRADLIVSGGENVNPIEVENIIMKIKGVTECAVVGVEDKEWGHKVCAVVSVHSQISPEEIRKFLRGKIADYKIPKEIVIADELPKTSLGKIRREKVKELIKSLT